MTIQIDKITHFLACYAIAMTIAVFTSWWIGLLSAILIGGAKELLDKWTGKGTPDWMDFVADLIGAELGTLIMVVDRMILN